MSKNNFTFQVTLFFLKLTNIHPEYTIKEAKLTLQ